MISTPHTALKWLLELGIKRDTALKIIESRNKFEYFVLCIDLL